MNIFRKKKDKPTIHADSCNCGKCTGMDSMRTELHTIRKKVSDVRRHHEHTGRTTKYMDTLMDDFKPVPDIVDLGKIGKVNTRKRESPESIAAKYLYRLGGNE
jgi:hypothetical protein